MRVMRKRKGSPCPEGF